MYIEPSYPTILNLSTGKIKDKFRIVG